MAEAAAQEEAAPAENEMAESLEEMLARHRKEIAELQNKETSLKKAAAKGSKAEQKAKKKQVEEEISRLLSDLKIKHSEELSCQNREAKEKAGTQKPTKSAKRREKKAQKELERENRIREEQSGVVSDREAENRRLEEKLEPLGLTIREMKPDGHCLYRAVADQLSSGGDFLQLRRMAADYMREHELEFLPFFLAEGKADFKGYCDEVEKTAAWGGELELEALARRLRRHILVFSGSFPDVEMGKEYENGGGEGPTIFLSYHRHAFGLGEHYNSVVPVEMT